MNREGDVVGFIYDMSLVVCLGRRGHGASVRPRHPRSSFTEPPPHFAVESALQMSLISTGAVCKLTC
jgi:hypothetical protein